MKRLLSIALLTLMIVVFGAPALTHAAQPYAVAIDEGTLARNLQPGTSGIHWLRIYNTGTNYENFFVQVSSTRGWFTSTGIYSSYDIMPGSYAYVSIPVSVPAGTANGIYDTLTVTVTSQNAPAVTESSLFFTRAVVGGGASALPKLEFAVASYNVNEADGTIDVTVVSNIGPVPSFASVDYNTLDGTAVSSCYAKGCIQDYVAKSGRLIFYPGESSKVITIDIAEDKTVEPLQYFDIQLSHWLDTTPTTQSTTRVTIAD